MNFKWTIEDNFARNPQFRGGMMGRNPNFQHNGDFNGRKRGCLKQCFNSGRRVCPDQRNYRRSSSLDRNRTNQMWKFNDSQMRKNDFFNNGRQTSVKPIWEPLSEESLKPSTSRQKANKITSNFTSTSGNKVDRQPSNADEVIRKMISLFMDKKKMEKNEKKKVKYKLVKRVPLPPFTGTQIIGEEGITTGFFCKYCNVYCVDKDKVDKHVLTKSHFKKYKEFTKAKVEDNEGY